ncbi:MAG: response regulator transcription factor, partial [Bryobacterales bacterium]|nr:response regulator transcription factor [Bryobacterales bacterium]
PIMERIVLIIAAVAVAAATSSASARAAEKMNVSINTVRNYIRGIYEKLHVHSKSEAVSKAIRHGLIGWS